MLMWLKIPAMVRTTLCGSASSPNWASRATVLLFLSLIVFVCSFFSFSFDDVRLKQYLLFFFFYGCSLFFVFELFQGGNH